MRVRQKATAKISRKDIKSWASNSVDLVMMTAHSNLDSKVAAVEKPRATPWPVIDTTRNS